jgi:hypothetical protein
VSKALTEGMALLMSPFLKHIIAKIALIGHHNHRRTWGIVWRRPGGNNTKFNTPFYGFYYQRDF